MTAKPQTFILRADRTRPQVQANLVGFIGKLPSEKAWKFTIEPFTKERSQPQNAYLHGVVYKTLSEHTGFNADEIHEYCLGSHFGWVERTVMGHTTTKPRRTTTTDEHGKRAVLSTTEFMDYVARCQQIGAEAGVYIDDPSPSFTEGADHA